MEAHSNYYIKDKHNSNKVVIVTDENPKGVTLTIKDNAKDGGQESFNLPRIQMIEALEYLLMKIKARPTPPEQP
jgi:hypothetical protein